MFWIIPLIFLILFEIVADIFAKEYSLKDHWYLWAGALLAYVVANMFWLWGIKSGSGLGRGATRIESGRAFSYINDYCKHWKWQRENNSRARGCVACGWQKQKGFDDSIYQRAVEVRGR